MENKTGLYTAFKAKDARFDGRFYVGISSTGIYCRPVCRAKQPKAENCTFFQTAAEAEQAGYRPCLLCRPELAPGASVTDASANLVCLAARLLEESCGSGDTINETASKLGCSSRHLRRVFKAEYNVTPVQYLQTCRLLLAKSLLTDTKLSVLDVAMSAGFGSLRRFNDLFKKHYRLSPTALRKQKPAEGSYKDNITLSLGYRPPYRWDELLKFFECRSIPGIDMVQNEKYLRTVRMKTQEKTDIFGWICIENKPEDNKLAVSLSDSLLPVLPRVLARIRNMFDLYCDPEQINSVLSKMNTIRPELYKSGIRIPGCFDNFEMAVRTILGQQISVKAASTLAFRIVEKYGIPVQTGIEGLTHIFPSPCDILALDKPIEDRLCPLGLTSARANTIYELAKAFDRHQFDFGTFASPEDEMKKLLNIRGIGSWTAEYIAMRAIGWPDAFLKTDAGIKKAMGAYTSKELLQISEEWRPWRSYATISLWNSL